MSVTFISTLIHQMYEYTFHTTRNNLVDFLKQHKNTTGHVFINTSQYRREVINLDLSNNILVLYIISYVQCTRVSNRPVMRVFLIYLVKIN